MEKSKKYMSDTKVNKNPIETVLNELNIQLQNYLEALRAVSEIEPQIRRKYPIR